MVRLSVSQTSHTVFDDHNGTIYDDPEVQCAKAHQVGTDTSVDHAREGKQHGERDHHRGDDGRANVAQEQEQHHDHQDGALHQVLSNRADGLVHQVCTVVDRDGVHALWEG